MPNQTAQSTINDVTSTFGHYYQAHGIMGVVILIAFVGAVYLLFPILKRWMESRQARKEMADDWVMRRMDKLQAHRDNELDRIRLENEELTRGFEVMAKKFKRMERHNAKLEMRLQTFEWRFLNDVCAYLTQSFERDLASIAKRLESKSGDELANALRGEFGKAVIDVRNIYFGMRLNAEDDSTIGGPGDHVVLPEESGESNHDEDEDGV